VQRGETIVGIRTVDEYAGQSGVRIAATQLGNQYTAHRAKKIVDEWCEFFSAGPSPITDLSFTSRTPRRLFESLAAQVQLNMLRVKWGNYESLDALEEMHELTTLRLGGASSLRSLAPLARLPQLRVLGVESLRYVHDLTPLGSLLELRDLGVGGDWKSPRIAHVDSFGFLRNLKKLERLILHTIIVDDLDYSPLLSLDSLTEVRVMAARGMRPTHDELSAAIPALKSRAR